MAEIYLVRHGQASLGEVSYDRLSPLGLQQSELLGRYFGSLGLDFDKLVVGSQQRHRDTADRICHGMRGALPTVVDADLNEYNFDQLIRAYVLQHPRLKNRGVPDPRSAHVYLKSALLLWIENRLEGEMMETWQQFKRRVGNALRSIQESSAECVLVVSSGGPIATFAHVVLGTPAATAIALNLQLRNTSFSHYYYNTRGFRLASYNNLPHLEQPEHLGKVTYA